jgi:hypothetical protein
VAVVPAPAADFAYAAAPAAVSVVPAAPQAFGDQVYTQQCIEQLQQEVQQHLLQLEQSRLHEQMLAAALQQQQQQQQMSGGVAGAYNSSSVAVKGPVALPVPATTMCLSPAALPLSSALTVPALAFDSAVGRLSCCCSSRTSTASRCYSCCCCWGYCNQLAGASISNRLPAAYC